MLPCTAFDATALLGDMSGALSTRAIAVAPGTVLHEDGVRRLVLNTWYSDHGELHNLTVVALSHDDTRGIHKPQTISQPADWAQRLRIEAQSPQPSNRRWWLAIGLDDEGRYRGANGFCDGQPCEMCSPRSYDPDLQTREPCRRAHAHAWNQVGFWEDQSRNYGVHYILGVTANGLGQARKAALRICERIRTTGHL
ncbi:hypothetical protein PUR49_08205 [Streptomyces sp. BE147]|uniref:hypothetical protein n=1 Tax=Streptomyces sp. BE147 TaxID=3002524 RepID=UPI002E75E094|nr:hypothetical protein [Streptomyces sp. BE147]MEE1736481.1 hypothetical protein [Streptomyces sp. BE147]